MNTILYNPKERTRFLRFAVVGTIGAVVDFGMMNLQVKLLSFPLVVAGTISFIAAILSNFLWNRFWTYPDSRSKPFFNQILQFYFVNSLGLLIRLPILKFLEPVMFRVFQNFPVKIPFFNPDFLAKNFTLAIAVVVVMFWNFFVNRYWTYNDIQS